MVLTVLSAFGLSGLLVFWLASIVGWLLFALWVWRGCWWPLAFRLLWWLATPPGSRPGYFFRLVGWLTAPRPSRSLRKKYVSIHQYVRQLKAQLRWQISPWNPANFPQSLRTLFRRFFRRPLTPAQQEAAFRQAAKEWQESLARFRAAGKCPCGRCYLS